MFDKFASEHLSEDNSFNFVRCQHILEELSSRADTNEIKSLRDLASTLKLSKVQIDKLDKRINEIAIATTPTKAISICRLYLQNPKFDKVYLEKALSLVKAGESLDINELKTIIGYQTNADSLPDAFAPFVQYITSIEQDFVDSAIVKIKAHKSTELLKKYWKVKEDVKFLTSLLSNNFENWKDFTLHIAQYSEVYLTSQTFKDSFCVAVNGNNDLDFTLSTLELLLKKGIDVKQFYTKVIIAHSSKKTDINESLVLINRGLNHVVNDKLLTIKKRFIRKFIRSGDLDKAETEIRTILSLDFEAATLLAELLSERARQNQGESSEYEWLFKVLSVNEAHKILKRFDSSLNKCLERLSQLTRQFYSKGNLELAYKISERLSTYSSYWIPLHSWLRSQELVKSATLNEALRHDAITIETISKKCPDCKNFESDEFISLWSRYIDNTLKKAHSQPKDKAISSLNTLKIAVDSLAPATFSTEKINEITNLIVKFEWVLANEYEQDLSFTKAIALYEEIAGDKVQAFANRAELRALICYLKSNNVSEIIETRINIALELKSYQTLKEDLAYRYTCYLLQSTRLSQAEAILKSYLPEETQLLNMCENIYIKKAENKLAEFNLKIKAINEGKMSLNEAIVFKSLIHNYKKQITEKLTDLGRPFGRFVPLIEEYILKKMFEDESYVDLLNRLMQENPNYVENDIDFRNIAIASLGIIESDEKDKTTLMRAIATVLTAIYKDRLFVQSLDYTSWDDKYTFSLAGSLGRTSYDDYDELPDNVNFDTPVENENVAIRDVQNSLLTRVEAAVRKYHPELEKFCTSEKDALDKLIELNLDKEYILSSPHLCRTLASLRMSIGNAFEYELNQNYGNREDVIALGVDYGFTEGEYGKYRIAYNALQTCKNSLSDPPAISIAASFNALAISQIKKYKKLIDDLKSTAGTVMNEDIRSEMDFKKFLNKYEIICKVVGDTTLSLTCSNYVNGEVVHLLNNDDMELREGVGYMVRIFNIAPNNFQVKKNLEGILSNLAFLVMEQGLQADKKALKQALADTGTKFTAFVIQAKLSVIVDKVNSGKMKNDTALSEVYSIYQESPNNERVCENLATLCENCIFEYVINGSSGVSGVKTTLNKVARNMSPTFKRKARKLGVTFNDMWNKIPLETKNLMCGGFGTKSGRYPFTKSGDIRSLGRMMAQS